MYSPDNYIVVLIVIKYSMLTYSEFKACRLSHKIENCLNKGHKALSERSESNVDRFHNCINELEVPNYRLLFLIFGVAVALITIIVQLSELNICLKIIDATLAIALLFHQYIKYIQKINSMLEELKKLIGT